MSSNELSNIDETNRGQWDIEAMRNNQFTSKISTDLNNLVDTTSHTLGVEQELRRFAMREYLNTKDKQVLVGADDSVVEEDLPEDDLLLTNAVSENKIQDGIDKTRYLKEVKSYVSVTSAARKINNLPGVNQNGEMINITEPSLFSTGSTLVGTYTFFPFVNGGGTGDGTDRFNFFSNAGNVQNYMTFTLVDARNSENPQSLNPVGSGNLFGSFFPVSPIDKTYGFYTAEQLGEEIQYQLNQTLYQQLGDFGGGIFADPNGHPFFNVTGTINQSLNADLIQLVVNIPSGFIYTLKFLAQLPSQVISRHLTSSSSRDDIITGDEVFPDPNSYVINLNKSYSNVKSLRIIESEIPSADTIINIYNNHIVFSLMNGSVPVNTSDGNSRWNYYITVGNYTVTQLATEMQLQINNMIIGESGSNNADVFSITADLKSGAFEIKTKSPYTFHWIFAINPTFGWRNLYRMLGFPSASPLNMNRQVDVFNNLVYVNTGDPKKPFDRIPYGAFNLKLPGVIWMILNNYENIYDTLSEGFYFAKFDMKVKKGENYAYNTFMDAPYVFVDAPLPSLDTLEVRFFDELGNPANFQGIENTFTLEIVQHLDRLMGVDYSSRRGVNDKTSYI
jgi:hypothetical protein